MKRRTVYTIILGAIVLHAGLFFLFGQMRALPKTRHIPPPNFGYKEETYENPKTGEKTVYRQIRVSTKLTDRDKLERTEPANPQSN